MKILDTLSTILFTLCQTQQKFLLSSAECAYIIDVKKPSKELQLNIIPVLNVHCLLGKDIILLSNFTDVQAHSSIGLKWDTDRIVRDGLTITNIDDRWIYGHGDDQGKLDIGFGPDNFIISVETGKFYGGGLYNLKNSNRLGSLEDAKL